MEPLEWYRIAAPVAFVAGLAVICAIQDLPRFRAMLLGIAVLVGYAVGQDQVSARLCPEYFTVFHNPIPGVTDPTLLGMAWGFLGAWWGGAILGYTAGIAATSGSHPPMPIRDLIRPLMVLVAGVGFVSALTGAVTYRHAEFFAIRLDPRFEAQVPADRARMLFVVANYHLAGYIAAGVGSVGLCVWIARQRAVKNHHPFPGLGVFPG